MTGSHAIIAIRAVLNELEELLDTNQWPGVSGECNDRERAEHRVDRAAL
jgi:hypothetical protein